MVFTSRLTSLSAEYQPVVARRHDDEIARITQGLTPDAPEFAEIIHGCKSMKRVVANPDGIIPRPINPDRRRSWNRKGIAGTRHSCGECRAGDHSLAISIVAACG